MYENAGAVNDNQEYDEKESFFFPYDEMEMQMDREAR